MHVLLRKDFPALLQALKQRGFTLVGPSRRDAAIVYGEVSSVEDFPEGWTDKHAPGSYELTRRNDRALFGYVVAANSWKSFLYPPKERLLSAAREGKGFRVEDGEAQPMRYAFIGVRPCDLHAIDIQDRVFTGGSYVDPAYRARRQNAFVVTVNCTETREHCFCASMNTGPRAQAGFDLALTELIDGNRHSFLCEAGSARGEEVLKAIPVTPAGKDEQPRLEKLTAAAAKSMGRSVNTDGLKEALFAGFDHPRWDDVAKRCLACTNCTMVCPTCFCSGVHDVTDLTGDHAERWRHWDSCFTLDYAKVAGGNFRPSVRARYRQWLMHKLSNWVDQFGTMGCVGCGRCITWCPVGIDITVEAETIRKSPVPARTAGA